MDKPKIIVKNTCVQLQGYKFGSCPPIENNFLCYEPTTHSYYFLGLYYDEEKEILYLPRGLDIWYIENQFQEKAIVERDMFNDFDVYNDGCTECLLRRDDGKGAEYDGACGKAEDIRSF